MNTIKFDEFCIIQKSIQIPFFDVYTVVKILFIRVLVTIEPCHFLLTARYYERLDKTMHTEKLMYSSLKLCSILLA